MLCDSELACARATRVRQQSTSRHALVGVVKRVTVQTGLVAQKNGKKTLVECRQ
jgi:hypothetical protein